MMNVSSILSSRRALLAVVAAGLMGLGSIATAQTAPQVKLSTSQGDIVLELYPAKAPKTVENFLQYVKDKHYDGTVFHRVMDGFMIQGGGFTADMTQKATRAPIAPNPDGYGYAVFGKVVSGMDVVDKIKLVPTTNKGPHQNVPATPVTINSATQIK